MAKARLPLGWRDNCAGLLIPLNKCRHENFYLPWKCTDEKHGYEKCQYEDMMRRMKIAQRQLVAKAQEEEE
ncbi:uncharacterized protein L969DRAFT_85773 [Mixia osmundae IAM 14324]|nr:uncharacterized protein L969DRAFT_85773 [Mixia osmundae IAM 14324]KEI40581.1 hypothetical protein L969DRAFT_85773 [Mixia osmundae IAM 14324]